MRLDMLMAKNGMGLPSRRAAPFALSAMVHAAVAAIVLSAIANRPLPILVDPPAPRTIADVRRIVFLPSPSTSAGGGGGGNHQPGPIRRAESIGTDAITVRVARPQSTTGRIEDSAEPPGVVLAARPLSSGTSEQVGLPGGGVPFGVSTGPGSGGGVGDGAGTGIGSGRGPGLGSGSGGGIGGGVYLPGRGVTSPRVVTEVKPRYTSKALFEKIQGTVVVEAIVRANGVPSDIRVIGSLDPDGLDRSAIAAVAQWRFEPGRLAGAPVDVLVNVMLQFSIR